MELLFTQNEVDSFLQTVDLENPSNLKVFSAIQLITPSLFNEVIYLLINGRITLAQLALMPINNSTIKQLVDSLTDIPVEVVDKVIFYKNYLKTLPAYNDYFSDLNENSQFYLARKLLSSSSFATKVTVDSIGFVPHSYRSISAAKAKYNQIFSANSNALTSAINAISTASAAITYSTVDILESVDYIHYQLKALPVAGSLVIKENNLLTIDYIQSGTDIEFFTEHLPEDLVIATYNTVNNSYDMSVITSLALAEIWQNGFIFDGSGTLPLGLNGTNSISGFALRDLIHNVKYSNILENINWLAEEMSGDYAIDTLHNGIPTITRLLSLNPWSDLVLCTSAREFFDKLSRLYFLRITVLKWVSPYFLDVSIINAEIINFNRVKTVFTSLKVVLDAFSTTVRNDMYVY